VGDKIGAYRFLVGDPRKGERLILERNFMKWDGDARNGLLWLMIGTDGVLL
jgi:hypothetical protein